MKRRRRIFATVTLLAAVLVGAACSDYPGGGGPTQPGTLTLRLTTPHDDDDGAIMFELSGPPVDNATAAGASLRLLTRKVDDATIRGAVLGTLANGAVVTVHVSDVNAVAQYTARVLEVADRQDVLRDDLTGYVLVVTR
jgi:hypothetical protein